MTGRSRLNRSKKSLKDLPDDEARLKAVGHSMNIIWTQAGLS
jgi:hypothetical protein